MGEINTGDGEEAALAGSQRFRSFVVAKQDRL